MNMKKKLIVTVTLLLSVIATLTATFFGCEYANNNRETPKPFDRDEAQDCLVLHHIDVQQGDSTFIELPNGETMLIDAGEANYGDRVLNYIKTLGYTKIDYVVGTHPHSDHIGGLETVVNNLNIGAIYMPKVNSNTKTYENLLKTISEKNLKIKTAKSGVNIVDGDDLKVDIIAPMRSEYTEVNNYSAVIMITYGKTKFLYMGDAEKLVEEEIAFDISNCDVVKVGHHGSDTSSCKEFVANTNAKIAVISVGVDNTYGHPNNDVLKNWQKQGTKIYRTDECGNIILYSDGSSVNVAFNNENSDFVWILNTSSMKIHYPTCKYANEMSAKNKKESNETLDDLMNRGYEACKVCKPN